MAKHPKIDCTGLDETERHMIYLLATVYGQACAARAAKEWQEKKRQQKLRDVEVRRLLHQYHLRMTA